MHYYIDGYNLLFRVFRACGEHLKNDRQQMVDDLTEKIQSTGISATLIFDSQHREGESFRFFSKHLEIMFSSHGETADEAILNEIKAENKPRHAIVVTSDKKLAWFARRCSARTESVEDFLELLNRRHKNKQRENQENHSIKKIKSPVVATPPLIIRQPLPLKGSLEYYLESFEKTLKEGEKIIPPPPYKKKPIIFFEDPEDSTPLKIKERAEADDMTRWLNVFEQRLRTTKEKM